jgi:hypothetical protein
VLGERLLEIGPLLAAAFPTVVVEGDDDEPADLVETDGCGFGILDPADFQIALAEIFEGLFVTLVELACFAVAIEGAVVVAEFAVGEAHHIVSIVSV